MAEAPIASAWCDSEALAAVSEQLARERVVQLSGFLTELPELPPAGKLTREEWPGFAVRATGPPQLADFWRSPPLAEWLAQATGARWALGDCRHECYGPGDYSLLHDAEGEGERLLLALDLTRQPQAVHGGFHIFSFADGAQAICERETGALLLARLGAGDLHCVRYVSQLSQGAVRLECAHFELS
ncbi:MAG: hypothetical protein CL960_05620 [Euryarchaeota archaeon]|jgi:hypothetical protein|nr:hypothetical protein [Euryarchaeota archaeon]MDP6363757.1 hypothetical protein [Candidatus Poseidoniia archaeon]MDP6658339.1 hypothetical protein [Candidatus Poseidoniia archaeon]MDP6846460.1 hypothetical protein [Candidatus Poseidoniia archaeon]MDP7006972.1 hypothetical protein [Candidatus Poseidoniia archaeon]|tara:strand:+ start:17218 stop:17775 length:558 start_codon:yes stop_codon:yes gene_type:complete